MFRGEVTFDASFLFGVIGLWKATTAVRWRDILWHRLDGKIFWLMCN